VISLEDLRKIDPELNDLTDEELEQIRAELYQLGQLAFDVWWLEKDGSKNPVGSLTEHKETASI